MPDVGNVAQVNGRTVWVARDDQVAVTLGLINLSIGLQDKGAMRPVELPRAGIDGPRFNRAGEVIHSKPTRSKGRRVGFDSNRALYAVDVYLRNTGQDVDALGHDGGCIFVKVPVRQRV